MSEIGGLDIGMPDEGVGGAPEQLSEEAKQRFAASGAAMKQARKQEKKSRQKDDQVAKVIVQFLGQDENSHLFVLISRLVARDCPSIFILAILSLIHDGSKTEVYEYVKERTDTSAEQTVDSNVALTTNDDIDAESNKQLIEWITRMQLVLSTDPEAILLKLMLDEKNIDGTVLQLTAFVLQEFFKQQQKSIEYEKIQPLTAAILQLVFEPFMGAARAKLDADKPAEE